MRTPGSHWWMKPIPHYPDWTALAGRTHEEAVQENLDDLIEQHRRGEIDWRGMDAETVAAYLEHWNAVTGGRAPFIAEAFWRYYEWANEAVDLDEEEVGP
jgi:hypothetical protein